MPFEIAPQFVSQETKVGQFQKFADAMLRGCAVTQRCTTLFFADHESACALGAIVVGLGLPRDCDNHDRLWSRAPGSHAMCDAYRAKYGVEVFMDNDSGRFTREEIAARIAAL